MGITHPKVEASDRPRITGPCDAAVEATRVHAEGRPISAIKKRRHTQVNPMGFVQLTLDLDTKPHPRHVADQSYLQRHLG